MEHSNNMGRTKQTKREGLPGKRPLLPPVGNSGPSSSNNASASGGASSSAATEAVSIAVSPAKVTPQPQPQMEEPKTETAMPSDLLGPVAVSDPKKKKKKAAFPVQPQGKKKMAEKKKVPADFEAMMLKSKQKVSKLGADIHHLEREQEQELEESEDYDLFLGDEDEEEEEEAMADMNFDLEAEENLTEAPPMLKKQYHGKGLPRKKLRQSPGVTNTIGPNFTFLEDRHTFPMDNIKEALNIDPTNDNILDFTGCAQVTDAVLSCMLDLPFNVRGSVIGVRLTGCHLVTDAGVEFLAECFHVLKKLTLAGCPRVTEGSLMIVARKCQFLETLDVAGTSVAVIPRKLTDLILVTDCCPLVSPLPSEMKSLPPASADMTKVVVIRREGESTLSPLRLLQGEKEAVGGAPFGFKANFPCGKDQLLNIIECSQSTLDLFCHGWGVYVIPSELTDKTKIEQEAKAVLAVILSILLKTGGGTFVLLGMHTLKGGAVPMAVVVEKVQDLAKALASSLSTKKSFLSNPDSLGGQLEVDQIKRLKLRIKELSVTSLEVNTDQPEAVNVLRDHLASESSKNPESREPCKTLAELLQGFPDKVGKDLKQGLHTLNGAAKFLLQGSAFKSPLEAQGAVMYLTKMGKLCLFKQGGGREVYISAPYLCQILAALCEQPPRSQNKTKDVAVSDQALVMTLDELTERATKAKATVELVSQLIRELQVLGTQGLMGDLFIPYAFLPPQPDFSMDRFAPLPSLAQVTYLYALPFPLPLQVWRRALSRLAAFCWPLHLWRQGMVVHRGIVEVLVTCEGDRITLLGQTISVSDVEREESKGQSTLWQCVEEYKLLLDAEFTHAGLMPQVTCTSDKPKPEWVSPIVSGHSPSMDPLDSRCQFCGDTTEMTSMILNADSKINPKMLSTSNIIFSLFDEPEKGGSLKGSNVTLKTGGKANIYTRTVPTGKLQVTLLFNSGTFQELQLTLQAASQTHKIQFGEEDTVSLKPMDSRKAGEISKAVPGVAINITLDSVVNDKVECTVDCHGEVLARQTLPYDQYRLGIQAKEKYHQASQQMPQLAVDKVQFTVLCTDFMILSGSHLKKGMKLEAVDRKYPDLICVATIGDVKPERKGKGGPLLIQFDGWTSSYDYWAEETSADLHPVGFMEQVGHKDKTKRTELQKPQGYNKEFDWATYLQEQKAEPVPYGFFNASQLQGTTPETIVRAYNAQGLWVGDSGEHTPCFLMPHRHGALEQWSRKELKKNTRQQQDHLKVSTFLKVNSRIFCLLPSDLDLQFLRYPSMAALCQMDRQSLHLLCQGQDNMCHLVDHKGLNCAEVFSSYQGQELFLQCAYLLLSLSTAMTIPVDMKNLCQVASVLPDEQLPRLQMGFQRLYRLYLMLFRFLHLLNTTDTKTQVLDGETQIKLLEALKKDADFGTHFSHSPDFTKIYCKAHHAAMSNDKGLATFPEEVFELGRTGTLPNLHLSGNGLESLPPDLSQRLPNLSQLFLSKNKLTTLPSLAGFKNLTHLYLASNQLTSVELTDNLSSTLVALSINDNPLVDLPASLSKMSQLVGLVADNSGVIKSLDAICGLKKLKSASFSSCVVSSLPGKFHTCQLSTLLLAAIPLVKPRSTSGMEQISTESLMKSYEKYKAFLQLSQEERADLFKMAPEKPEEENIAAINERLLKHFPRLGGANFPPHLLHMSSLRLLDLSHQGFATVPDEIKNLKQLTELTLNGCYNLESLSAQLSTLPLDALSLNDCPVLKTPPPEIVNRGFQAVFGYLRRLQMGSVVCKRTKLMMVGLGGAGKTSLVRSLRSGNFHVDNNYEEMITDGIDICEWNVPIEGEDKPLQFSVWDFAGQTVYYNTHQFFMSNRAVYLLLWNIRLGYEHAGLDFWLSSIACHAPQAPVLIVGTHYDKVKKTHIPEVELKRRFPQIHGFHFVSSYTGHGMQKLEEDLKAVTLTQKYMGEKIPEVWLNLEKQLNRVRDEGKALLPWKDVETAGNRSGIFDNLEMIQAVQFLHDLGSVQFFNTDFLRSNVVIVPQWIVDVMACVVTVHEGPIKKGVLQHADVVEVWHAYPRELHPWLLRLTEEFDLTFCLPDQPANIIPCLLPDTEPEFEWPKVSRDSGEREMKMVYKFDYLPAGLFNRAQVRLHEFSDSAILWKKGSMLRKNRHSALVLQTGSVEVLVKAQGYKPENVLFLVHEVFECLIAESYSGVHYDYFIPCMECLSTLQSEPCMFPRSKVHRAVEFKAPFLQCDSFHIMSIPEIMAIMPPDKSSDFDEHLHRSVHELHSLGEEVAISVFVCYSRKNVPSLAEDGKQIHPSFILEDLRQAGYKVSFTDDPESANMEALTLSMKAAQVVIIGISDEFLSNKQCYSLIFYTRETLKKPFLLMTLGKTANWQKQDINFLLGNEVYVKMQDISRYNSKIKELVSAVKTKAGVKAMETYPDCFISYCWKNSQRAVSQGTTSTTSALGWGDPRAIRDFLGENGVTSWLDVEQMGQEGFYEDLARGVRTSKVMIAFVSDEYALSKTCRMEFQFALEQVRIPVIVAVVGTGYQWESSEIGMLGLGHGCPKVNLQLENKAGLEEVVRRVKEVIGAATTATTTSTIPDAHRLSSADQQKISFQEALELTERKLLRQLVMYKARSGHTEFPHLVFIDLLTDPSAEGQGQEAADGQNEKSSEDGKAQVEGEEDPRKKRDEEGEEEERGERREEEDRKEKDRKEEDRKEEDRKEEDRKEEGGGTTTGADSQYCFRVLCEWEQGWHATPVSIPFLRTSGDDDSFLKEVAPFCVRMMAVLKHTALPLPVLTQPQGEQLYKNFEEWSPRNSTEFEDAYKRLAEMVQKQDKMKTYGGLKRCHVTNGKQLWLCPEHSARMGNMSADVSYFVPAVTYLKPAGAEDHGNNDDDFKFVDEEEETSIKDVPAASAHAPPTPPPPVDTHKSSDKRTSETPKSSHKRKPSAKLSRTQSRACLIM